MIEKQLDKIEIGMRHKARLFETSKEKAREEILSFMIMHPAPSVQNASERRLPYYGFFNFIGNTRFVTAPLLAVIIFGSGISFAARSTVPGDTLYPIKTNVNEEVRGWFVLSSLGEAKLQAELAEERVREIEKLTVSGKAEPATIKNLEEKFKVHAEAVETKLTELQSKDAHEEILNVSADFESSLKAHETVLENLPSNNNEEVKDVLSSVGDEIDRTKETKNLAGDKIETDKIIEKESAFIALKAAKEEIQQAETIIDDLKEGAVSKKTEKEAETKLKAAKRAYSQGRDKYYKEEYGKAYVEFSMTRSSASEAKLYIDIQTELSNYLKPEASPEVSPAPSGDTASTTESTASSTPIVKDESTTTPIKN